jgi:tRNA threonylcarbamoyladenosine biosynthesis protein TsaE
MKFYVKSVDDLKDVIECIKKSKKNKIILSGTLGSGKTTLVKEFVKSLGINENVTSPTFSIQNIYDNKVFHYDLYNKDINQFLSLGMLEELLKDGYHFIEWGEELEKILKNLDIDYLKIKIDLDNVRIFECQNL